MLPFYTQVQITHKLHFLCSMITVMVPTLWLRPALFCFPLIYLSPLDFLRLRPRGLLSNIFTGHSRSKNCLNPHASHLNELTINYQFALSIAWNRASKKTKILLFGDIVVWTLSLSGSFLSVTKEYEYPPKLFIEYSLLLPLFVLPSLIPNYIECHRLFHFWATCFKY